MLLRQKEDIITTFTQVIKDNQSNFNPNPPYYNKPDTPSDKYGLELDKKSWIRTITTKLNKLKVKKNWLPAIENLRKCFKHNITLDFDDMNKKEAIKKLVKRFSLYGSPSEGLLLSEEDYDSNSN